MYIYIYVSFSYHRIPSTQTSLILCSYNSSAWGFASVGTGLLSSEVFAETKIANIVSGERPRCCALAELLDSKAGFLCVLCPRKVGKSSGPDARSAAGKYHQAREGDSAVRVNWVICTVYGVWLKFPREE